MTSSPNCGRAKADLSLLGYYAWGKANSGSDRSGSFPWFAEGSAGCRTHFRPPPSPSRSRAATPECWRSQSDGTTARVGLDSVLDQQGANMADLPGGASGSLVRGYKGKEAERLVTRITPGVVSLVAELR